MYCLASCIGAIFVSLSGQFFTFKPTVLAKKLFLYDIHLLANITLIGPDIYFCSPYRSMTEHPAYRL